MLIVDAFNVLHTTGVLPPSIADPGVPGLIRLIGGSRYAARDLTLVCDGGAGTACSGVRMDRARVLYSGNDREADDLIEGLIDRYHRGNPLVVVSSDARLRRAARRRRCGRIPSETFLKHLANDAIRPTARPDPATLRAQVPLDPYSVDGWLQEFGLPPAERPRHTPAPLSEAAPPKSDNTRPPRPKKHTTAPRPAPRSSIGEPLRLDLQTDRPAINPHGAEPVSRRVALPETHPAPSPTPPGTPSPPETGRVAIDPLLLEALEEWRDRLTIDDLDMQRWTPDATPLPPDRRRTPPRDPQSDPTAPR